LEGGGVLKRGLGDVALLTAFLARVSTKLDLMARDTAMIRWHKGVEKVRWAKVRQWWGRKERLEVLHCCCLSGMCRLEVGGRGRLGNGQYQSWLRGNRVGKWVRPRFCAAVPGSLNGLRETHGRQTTSIGSAPGRHGLSEHFRDRAQLPAVGHSTVVLRAF
jgi:hypothetical protein